MSYELTRDQVRRFRLLYGRRSNRELAQYFCVAVSEIEDWAGRLGLAKNKQVFPGTKMPRWTKTEIEQLREVFPNKSNLQIARFLGRSVKSIATKAHHLGLVKSEAHRAEMGRFNVAQRDDRLED